jgi:hypothetical protein
MFNPEYLLNDEKECFMDDNPDGCLDGEYHGSDHQERQPVEDSAWIASGLSDGLLECYDS